MGIIILIEYYKKKDVTIALYIIRKGRRIWSPSQEA